MSKREEAEQAIREWREAYEAVMKREAPHAEYASGWVRFYDWYTWSVRLSELRRETSAYRAHLAGETQEKSNG